MFRKAFALAPFTALALSLAACGGGGSGSSPVTPIPSTAPTVPPASSGRATASITIPVPVDRATGGSSTGRSPRFISPGTDKLTVFVDGAAAFTDVRIDVAPQPYVSADGNTKMTLTGVQSGAYYTYTATLDTLPGTHLIGVVIKGNAPPVILSEAQQTYALKPGNNATQTMSLLGALSTGYIMCDTDAHVAEKNGCANSFVVDPTPGQGGTYTLTAVGADFEGFPIPSQISNGNPLPYDNGSFSVVETDASAGTANQILTLTSAGPFTTPGTQLNQPSGGYWVPGTYPYGQPFHAKCNVRSATATLGLVTTRQGPLNGVTGQSYTFYNPSNTAPSTGNYPDAGYLATGTKTGGNPDYHNGSYQNSVTNIVTVNCNANFALTIN